MDVTWLSPDLQSFREWLATTRAEARRRLPELLDLSGQELERLLRNDPELCTAGMIGALTDGARAARERYPRRAHELTSLVIDVLIPRLQVPAAMAFAVAPLCGLAWTEHARALREVRRHADARAAVAVARDLFDEVKMSDWFFAAADLAEAPMLYDAGEHEAALLMVRAAAEVFDLHGEHELLLEAAMTEATMLATAGDLAAATRVWEALAAAAQQWCKPILGARADARMGMAELHRNRPVEAVSFLTSAVRTFVAEGLVSEAADTRWHLAEALAACGGLRVREAVSEYHLLRAELLSVGRIRESAMASLAVLRVLLESGREAELPPVTERLVETFQSVFQYNALSAFTYLRARAEAEALTYDDLVAVRRYFEDYAQQPNAVFTPPV
jgi:hypothetical protein